MSLPGLIRSSVDHNDWGTKMPYELILLCFGELEPEGLIRSSEVCLCWHKAASKADFYLKFAQRVKYFCCENGLATFTVDPKSLFLKYYSAFKAGLPRLAGQTCYQSLQYYQSPAGFDDLKKIWDGVLPSAMDLQKNGSAFLATFPYQENVATLMACLSAGALTFEDPLKNRLYYLSCFHGDIGTVTAVLEEILFDLTPCNKLKVLESGIILAVEGKQLCIIRNLKNLGQVSVKNTILRNFNSADFAIGGPYAGIAECLTED